jgi:hypothetical protein
MWKRVWEWVGHLTVVQAIVSTEFVRSALLPTVVTVLTGGAGMISGQPLMWVIMASALAFAGTTLGLLGGSLYLERKNPQNKLKYKGTYFQHDLDPAPAPQQGNRQQRRTGANAW